MSVVNGCCLYVGSFLRKLGARVVGFFVAFPSNQVSRLAVHVASICSDPFLFRLLGLWGIEPNGCGLRVVRVAREW